MRMLQKGSTSPEVGLLRRMLNRKMRPSPNLTEAKLYGARYNGAVNFANFGPKTDAAVRKFQGANGLKCDGVVGPKTWKALGLTIDINKQVLPASQPTNDTCYAAAATMVLGPQASQSFDPGPPPAGVAGDDHWAHTFASQFSWQLEYGRTPMPTGLTGYLSAGPFWFAGDLPFPGATSYHAVVVGAMWGDGDSERTMLLIYDPWPVNSGETYGIILGDYLRDYPLAFRYIIHR